MCNCLKFAPLLFVMRVIVYTECTMHTTGLIFCALILFALAALCFAGGRIDRRCGFAPNAPRLLPCIAGGIFALLGLCLLFARLLGLRALAVVLFVGALALLILVLWDK